MKKLLTLTITLLMLALCSGFAFAAKEPPVVVDHVVYQLIAEKNDLPQHYEITDFFDSEDAMQGVKKLTIPAEIDGIPVMTIRAAGFVPKTSYVKSEVEEIVLPDTITQIGDYAFVNMAHLSKLELPASVTYLGRNAFLYCTALESITIPESVGTIGPGCFKACKNLKTVDIQGNGLKKIGYAAFGRCASLQYIDLPESLETIGGQAFFRSGLRLLRVPGGCTLKARALMNAYKLKKVVFEDRTGGNYPMGVNAFYGCKNLLKVYLPKKAYPYSIPGGAFADCTRLKAVYRTEHVQNVWNAAFEGCKSLSVFTVPAGIENIGPGAFRGCTALKKLRVLAETSAFLSVEKDSADFLQDLSDACKVYVKTNAMRGAFLNAGCPGRVLVKADLK